MSIGDPRPDHLLSLDEWAALPEDNTRHYELVDGVLNVSPQPAMPHQWVVYELGYQLRDQLPADLRAMVEVEMVVSRQWPATVRAPDLVVLPMRVAATNAARCAAEDVLLAVEVISPGSRKIDQSHKMLEYADAGILDYWILDIDGPVTLTAYRLIDGEYEIVGKGEGELSLTEPAPVRIDVAGLLPHRT